MKRQLLATSVAGFSLFLAAQAYSAGYYVDEQSALRLGDAFSGGAASASDASAAYYGPASMVLVRDELVINASAISANSKFKGSAVTGTGTVPITGSTAKTETTDLLPTLYFVKRLNEELVAGAYINAPFATGVEFGKKSVARYQAADSSITGIDAGFSLAYQMTEALSVGGSFVLQYLEATTGVAVNTSAVCLGANASGELPFPCASLGLADADLGTSTHDGYFEMKGHNLAAGFQLGALYQFSQNSRLGLNYRSQIRHSLTGTATADFPASAAGFTSLAGLDNVKGEGRVDITTPEVVNLSYFHQLGDLALQADLSYTNWTRFKEMRVESRDQGVSQLTENAEQHHWTESYRAALGASYKLNDLFTLRGGFAYDTTPIKDKFVKVDFPFEDYKALSLGVTYHLVPSVDIDAGVQHTFKQERSLNQGAEQLASSGSALNGKMTTEDTSFALGVRWAY